MRRIEIDRAVFERHGARTYARGHDTTNFFVKRFVFAPVGEDVVDGALLLRINMLLKRAEPLFKMLKIGREALVQRVDLLRLRARLLLLEVRLKNFLGAHRANQRRKTFEGIFVQIIETTKIIAKLQRRDGAHVV